MIKHIFFDFNGTIIDDVKLCLDLLNEILKKQGKKELSVSEYKNVFTFPIKKYYMDAGVSFEDESFEELSKWFILKYQPLSYLCNLYEGCVEAFSKLKDMGYHIYILSASKYDNLKLQTDKFDISKYFDDILGIDNIYASSKVLIAKNYIENNKINPSECLFIGDTIHDLEVCNACGGRAALVSCGHQSVEVLKSGNVDIIDSVKDIFKLL